MTSVEDDLAFIDDEESVNEQPQDKSSDELFEKMNNFLKDKKQT
jgi:hypothetical protein